MNTLVRVFCGVLRQVLRRLVLELHRRGRPARRGHRGIRIQNMGRRDPRRGL